MTAATASMPSTLVVPSRLALPALVACGVFATLMLVGDQLLRDPDTYWQIAVGRAILDTGTVPHTDVYSWTMPGQPWISTQWLAQVLLGAAYGMAGWAGPVALTAACVAIALGFLTAFVAARTSAAIALLMALIAMSLLGPHIIVRPHALVMPVVVAYAAGLVRAMDRRTAPSLWLLPLLVLWANVHGSFVFALMLSGACGLVALSDAEPAARRTLVLQWAAFGIASLAACCLTPYGFESFLAAQRILNLGAALSLIGEWRPANFGQASALEYAVLGGFALTLWRGVTLSLPRVAIVAGLVFMALSHVRNADMLALIAPLVLAKPLGDSFGRDASMSFHPKRVVVILFALIAIGSLAIAPSRHYAPDAGVSPSAAVRTIKEAGITRVLNDYDFGGYMIAQGLPVYIDGRAELYGEARIVAHNNFSGMFKPEDFFRLIDDSRVEATLLRTQSAATTMLDHLDGWKRIYSDDVAVVHMRDANAKASQQPRLRAALD